MILPFGKYRGHALRDIPRDYLEWLLAHVTDADPRLLAAAAAELSDRKPETRRKPGTRQKRHQRRDSPPPRRETVPAGVRREQCAAVIAAGRRALAAKYHPDKPGGNLETMQAVNAAADWLESHLREVFSR